ncbi:MAG TPA: hypothetical protein VFF06_17335 [Polyangia bacterium]|nr:hypothetical protein [Polyangia bacterium]
MKSNTLWALITGLAVGFIVGREFSRPGGGGESKPGAANTTASNDTGGAKDIPADWIKEAELGATDQFAGLTAAQRYVALKVLNEKPCDCGCPHGSVAKCKKEDPGCPRAPTIIATAVAMAKQGKSADEIVAAVKKPGNDAPPPTAGPQKVELAQWTPIKGPKYAKVTIVEYSDFQ